MHYNYFFTIVRRLISIYNYKPLKKRSDGQVVSGTDGNVNGVSSSPA